VEYAIYGVFVFWYLCSLPGLLIGLQFVARRDRSPWRPLWYYFASFAFGITATSVLLWLYSSDRIDEWYTIMLGWVIFLPEAIYLLWSQRGRGNKDE
jgi:hypothetical protein